MFFLAMEASHGIGGQLVSWISCGGGPGWDCGSGRTEYQRHQIFP